MTNAAHFVFRAYARALQLSPDASNLWHDLAVAYYYLGQVWLLKTVPQTFFLLMVSLHSTFPPPVSLFQSISLSGDQGKRGRG